jgi:hypothetical protein
LAAEANRRKNGNKRGCCSFFGDFNIPTEICRREQLAQEASHFSLTAQQALEYYALKDSFF